MQSTASPIKPNRYSIRRKLYQSRCTRTLVCILTFFLLIICVVYLWQRPFHRNHVTPSASTFRLNINDAQVGQLSALPGIGPTIAMNIAAYREKQGPFIAIEDLENVQQIGPRTVQRIKPYITLTPLDTAVASE